MPVEKAPAKPAPWPPVPQNDPKGRSPEAFPVVNDPKESFWTIAAKAGVDAGELVRYNFLTNKAEEINWYLKNYVGCQRTTPDGLNYKFQGATYQPAANKGVIFIPRAGGGGAAPVPSPVAPPKGLEPIEGSEFQAAPVMHEFNFARDLEAVNAGWVRYRPSVSGKVKFGEDSSSKISYGLAGGKIRDVGGEFIVKSFLDNVDLKIAFKARLEDFFSRQVHSRKQLAQKFGEAVEATFLASRIKLSEHCFADLDLGATLSTTPCVVKAALKYFGRADIGPSLGLAGPLTVKAELSVQFTFKIGPGPLCAQVLSQADKALVGIGGLSGAGGAAFVAFAYIGFIGFGAWYAGNAAARGERSEDASYYIAGYLFNCGFTDSLSPTTDPRLVALYQKAREDAGRDAATNFPGYQGIQAIQRWQMLWVLGAGGQIGTRQGGNAGRALLEAYLMRRMKQQFNF